MALFLAGMALVIFDFNLSAGGTTVGILPDTVGYLLLLLSLEKDGIFQKKRDMRRILAAAAAVNLVIYVLNLSGAAGWAQGWVTTGMDILSFGIEVTVTWMYIRQLRTFDLTVKQQDARRLFSAWRLYVIFETVSFLSILSPASAMLLFGFAIVADIYFLVMLFRYMRHVVRGIDGIYYGRRRHLD